jgi:predicted metalloprotease with PDZ domain
MALARYEYGHEQYSESLWLVEGLTSYYDNLLLSRAKRVRPAEYFKRLALDLHALETTPGAARISLREASYDAWIRHYRPDANSVNSTISYYTKGAVLGLVLDTRLRRDSNDRLSLDDVMRAMYQRWRGQPYPDDAFLDLVGELGGEGVRAWLEQLLGTPLALDIDEALAWYGLVLDRHPINNAAREAGKALLSGFGVTWEADKPSLVIATVIDGSSGAGAGLLPGDELLAISGERVTPQTIEDRMLRLRPGEQVELLLARRGRITRVSLPLEEARPATYEIRVQPDFGRRELRRLESWLGQPLELVTD